ncbi:MAG TPA: c-type cytochrome [Thermoanaerobaculia bacterium]|nr:c-type cytochrome [Thermoanaerobaculia bacterium]
MKIAATWALGLVVVAATALAAEPDLGTEQQRESGRTLYVKYCSQCHGESGDGVGPATGRVKPAPRDFTSGKYKFRTTPSGSMPTTEDLRRVIRDGLPYTSMPGWPRFSEQQITALAYYIKTFSPNFENPNMLRDPIEIPSPPSSDEESIARGRQVYEEQGCAACHGEHGRGDGQSAPTLQDEWGSHIRAADLTQRWTFRGGATRRDIFRTFSTGLNGTPMPSYADSLEVADRWDLVNYIYSLGDGDDPGYDTLLRVPYVERELDLEEGSALFEDAPLARFPLIGQITEIGRNFYPSTHSVDVRAVYNREEIAFEVRWHDMRAETSGVNGPDLAVPPWDEDNPPASGAGEASDDDFFGGFEEAPSDDDFFGELEADAAEDDFFGELEQDAPGGGADAFSDAVALQFPAVMPAGNRKPYFIFGDAQTPVDLWFVDLAKGLTKGVADTFRARGSAQIELTDADLVDVRAAYEVGEWTVVFKRTRRSSSSIELAESQYVPIAFSVWDGFNRERGNKRALSSWFYLYTEPSQQQSAVGPMLRVALLVLIAELVVLYLVRRRHRRSPRADAENERSVTHGPGGRLTSRPAN